MDICALRDGRVVTIRPIRGDDEQRLRASHDRLSPDSRYRRFMSAKPHLSASDARYLAHVDGRDHYALVATDAAGEIVAVARFIRLPEEPGTAEFAIVVGDDYQRRGLGAELLGRLADAAVSRGVTTFYAAILADNAGIRRLIDRLAAGPVRRRRDGTVFEVEFDLPRREAPAPPAVLRSSPDGLEADGTVGPAGPAKLLRRRRRRAGGARVTGQRARARRAA